LISQIFDRKSIPCKIITIKNLLIDSLLPPIVESTYFNIDMCKFESL